MVLTPVTFLTASQLAGKVQYAGLEEPMIKRLTAIAVAILLVISAAPGVTVAASMDDDDSNGQRTKRNDIIWEGLCVGASLDLSFESQVECAKAAQAAHDDDDEVSPPSIAKGLCVGASLDLSKASERKCARQVEARQKQRKSRPPNIQAGLCVGASLDLSRASQARCVRETQSSTDHRESTQKDNHEPEIEKNHQKKNNNGDDPWHHYKDKDAVATTETTTVPSHPAVQYAALGNSVPAGLGLSSPADTDDVCGRSLEAYPYQVASSRGLEVTNLACSGAMLGDLTTEQAVIGPNIPAQLDVAFAGGTPQLITITAGANDIGWDRFLRKCYSRTCGTERDGRTASSRVAELELELQSLFQEIQRRSNGSPPEVIMTGYYNPLSDSCAQLEPRLTLEEITWLSEQTAMLNQALENAASQSGFTTFVPIDFTGHDICSSDPWVQTLEDPAPFHPTTAGQQAIAQQIP